MLAADGGGIFAMSGELTQREYRRAIAIIEATDPGLAEKVDSALDSGDAKLSGILERAMGEQSQTMRDMAHDVGREMRTTRWSMVALAVLTILVNGSLVGAMINLKIGTAQFTSSQPAGQ